MDDTIKTSVRRSNHDVIIDLEGDLNTFSDEKIERAYQSVLHNDARSIFLNFDRVNFISSAGIAILINLIIAARKKNVELGIFGISDHFQNIFGMVGITKYAKVFQNEIEALMN